jgi:hypothetical protein
VAVVGALRGAGRREWEGLAKVAHEARAFSRSPLSLLGYIPLHRGQQDYSKQIAVYSTHGGRKQMQHTVHTDTRGQKRRGMDGNFAPQVQKAHDTTPMPAFIYTDLATIAKSGVSESVYLCVFPEEKEYNSFRDQVKVLITSLTTSRCQDGSNLAYTRV